MGKIKIHLIDDHQIVIDGLLAVLKMEDDFEAWFLGLQIYF